jgi:hypothetical protein
MTTMHTYGELLGVKLAKAYLTRQGSPTTALTQKIPDNATVSNVRNPWALGRKIKPAAGVPAGNSVLNPTIAR